MKLMKSINDKSLAVYTTGMATIATLASTSANAAGGGGSYDTYLSQNGGDKTLLSADGSGAVSNSVQGFINIIKWIALLIGIILVIGGLLSVKKASATEGQKSTAPGWFAVVIGGLMTIVTFIAVIIGNSAKGLAGG